MELVTYGQGCSSHSIGNKPSYLSLFQSFGRGSLDQTHQWSNSWYFCMCLTMSEVQLLSLISLNSVSGGVRIFELLVYLTFHWDGIWEAENDTALSNRGGE